MTRMVTIQKRPIEFYDLSLLDNYHRILSSWFPMGQSIATQLIGEE